MHGWAVNPDRVKTLFGRQAHHPLWLLRQDQVVPVGRGVVDCVTLPLVKSVQRHQVWAGRGQLQVHLRVMRPGPVLERALHVLRSRRRSLRRCSSSRCGKD